MFLSKLCLNLRHPDVRRQIRQPYEMHRTLWSTGFSQFGKEELGRVLFRIDSDRISRAPVVLIQSERQPDWTSLPSAFVIESPECKAFDPHLATGQRLRFRLRANPTKKIGSGTKSERLAGVKKNGKRVALFHENDQIGWLLDKGQHGGFTIPGQWREESGVKTPDFRTDVVREGWIRCGKEGHRDGDFIAVRFDGILVVNDADAFRQTLLQGVGSAKGFGFGLLSIARAEGMQ
jgi:CRISPR system Cascade subunit CasE